MVDNTLKALLQLIFDLSQQGDALRAQVVELKQENETLKTELAGRVAPTPCGGGST
jgi:hypothetical protein